MVCIRLNWLRFALGRLSISVLVMFVPICEAVVSTSGACAVTVMFSCTPARFIVKLMVSSWPTPTGTPLRVDV